MYSMNNNCFNTIYNIVIAKVLCVIYNTFHEKFLHNKRISSRIQFMFFEKSGVCHSLQVQYAKKVLAKTITDIEPEKDRLNVVKQRIINT